MLKKAEHYTNAEFKKEIDLRMGLVSNSTTWYEHASIIYNEKLRLKRGDTESVKWFLSKINKIHSHIGDVSLDKISKKYFRQIFANEYNSYNSPAYINKLDCKNYTSIRLQNDKKYVIGEFYTVSVKHLQKHIPKLVDKRSFTLDRLTEWAAMIHTGYGKEESKRMIRRMYSMKNLDLKTQVFTLLLFTQNQSRA